MHGVIKEEKLALVMEGTADAPRYRRVIVRDEVFPGADVVKVLYPDNEDPTWLIQFRDGTIIHTTHPVTVVENAR